MPACRDGATGAAPLRFLRKDGGGGRDVCGHLVRRTGAPQPDVSSDGSHRDRRTRPSLMGSAGRHARRRSFGCGAGLRPGRLAGLKASPTMDDSSSGWSGRGARGTSRERRGALGPRNERLERGEGPPRLNNDTHDHADSRRRHRSRSHRRGRPHPRRRRRHDRVGARTTPASSALERTGTPLPDELLDSIRRNKVALKGPVDDADRRRVHERQRRPAQGAGSLRQPAAGLRTCPAVRSRFEDVDLVDRPREHRGSLCRPRARGRAGRRREPEDHHGARLDAHRASSRSSTRGGTARKR